MDDFGFSKTTRNWLGGWLSGGLEITELPDIVVSETKKYSMSTNEKVVLYKALTKNDVLTNSNIFSSDLPSSWTYKLEVANLFKTDREIVSVVIGNSNVLIDTLELEISYMKRVLGGNPEEHEVILLPGSYRIKVVE